MLTLTLYTLGCKLNQLESEAIAQAFHELSFRVVPWGQTADLYIINTCTVTSKAEQKARGIIRKLCRVNPAACIIVTGCYAQLDGPILAGLVENHPFFIVPGEKKDLLLDLPAYLSERICASQDLPFLLKEWDHALKYPVKEEERDLESSSFRFSVVDRMFHTRASLKIQDGCDNACAYCRVRLARGRSRSLSAPEVLSRLQILEDAGYAEAIITGININQYRYAEYDFADLLRYLLDNTQQIALRISSIEPEEVNEDFLKLIAHRRIRPHFHISVQSGSDSVLQRMRRHYKGEAVEQLVMGLRRYKEDPFLACDIIAGFPGETDADFESTYELCRSLDFAWIHAFPFSPRPGTEAMGMDKMVCEGIVNGRVARLLDLSQTGWTRYLERWQGKGVDAIVERARTASISAVSDNYLKLHLKVPDKEIILSGDRIRCRIISGCEGTRKGVNVMARWVYTYK